MLAPTSSSSAKLGKLCFLAMASYSACIFGSGFSPGLAGVGNFLCSSTRSFCAAMKLSTWAAVSLICFSSCAPAGPERLQREPRASSALANNLCIWVMRQPLSGGLPCAAAVWGRVPSRGARGSRGRKQDKQDTIEDGQQSSSHLHSRCGARETLAGDACPIAGEAEQAPSAGTVWLVWSATADVAERGGSWSAVDGHGPYVAPHATPQAGVTAAIAAAATRPPPLRPPNPIRPGGISIPSSGSIIP